jgi:hypothetical protein
MTTPNHVYPSSLCCRYFLLPVPGVYNIPDPAAEFQFRMSTRLYRLDPVASEVFMNTTKHVMRYNQTQIASTTPVATAAAPQARESSYSHP